MILTIDAGNTRIKGAVYKNDTLLEHFFIDQTRLNEELKEILSKYKEIEHLAIASVANIDNQLFSQFEDIVDVHFISHKDPFPFTNKYSTPNTLGIDRMILSAGAVLEYPKQNRLIISTGTCITYDFVDEKDCYLGGAISPGLQLRYNALHNYTARLPLLDPKDPKNLIGDSTSESIHSGIINGLVFELDSFINEYKERCQNIIIILTGGDADFLAKRLKNTIFVKSNFLLESLNQTFQYKLNND